MIQRRLGLQIPVVEVFSNDPRLADLAELGLPTAVRRRLTDTPRRNDVGQAASSRATMGA